MENFLKYLEKVLIVILLFIVFFQQCTSPSSEEKVTTKQKVAIPEKKGSFEKPTLVTASPSKKDSIKWYKEMVVTENPFNKKLAEDFVKAQKERDSLKVLNLYLSSISEKEETYTFEDKNIKIDVKTKVRGELLKTLTDYKIKETIEKVDVKQKETTFALYTGASLEYITTLEKLSPKVSLGLQNKKGSILSLEVGLDKSVQIGYSLRLINIKK